MQTQTGEIRQKSLLEDLELRQELEKALKENKSIPKELPLSDEDLKEV